MTFLSSFAIKPVRHGNGQAPRHLDFSEISLVVPVHNNRQGTQRLLAACLDVFSPRRCPAHRSPLRFLGPSAADAGVSSARCRRGT